jgi:hypothetical protein
LRDFAFPFCDSQSSGFLIMIVAPEASWEAKDFVD